MNKKRIYRICFLLLWLFPVLCFSSKKDSTILIGGHKEFQPYQYLNEKGEAKGLFVDILDTLFTRLGYKTKYKLETWDITLNEFKENKFDLIVMREASKYDSIVDFSFPIIHDRMVFLVKKKSRYTLFSDLENRKIAIENHVLSRKTLKYLDLICKQIIKKDLNDRVKLLFADKCDAVLGLQGVLNYEMKKSNRKDEVRMLLATRFLLSYSVATHKGNQKMLAVINEGLIQMTADGTIDKIVKKWISKDPINNLSKHYSLTLLIVVVLSLLFFPLFLYHRCRRNSLRQHLQQNEEILYKVLDLIPYPIYIKEATAKGRFVYANEKAKKYFGEAFEFVDDWDKPLSSNSTLTKEDQEIMNGKTIVRFTDTVYLPSGDRYDSQVKKTLILYGKKQYILTSRTFVTRLLEARRLAQQSELLKSYFLINTNQEMFYPLHEINKLSEHLISIDDEKQQLENSELIRAYSNELLQHIDKAVNVSKIQSHALQLNREWVSFIDLGHEIEYICKQQVRQSLKLIEFSVDVPYLSGEVFIDKKQLKYVIDLLFRNAFTNMKDGSIRMGFIDYKKGLFSYFRTSDNLLTKEEKKRLMYSNEIDALDEGQLRKDLELAELVMRAVKSTLKIAVDEQGGLIIYAQFAKELKNVKNNPNANWDEIYSIMGNCKI